MTLKKETISFNFSQGVETKTDNKQLPIGQFEVLNNSVFTKGGLLQKRNGYDKLEDLPESASYLTVFKENLTALKDSLQAYVDATDRWVNKGVLKPVELDTSAVVRSNTNKSQADSVLSDSGLLMTVYTDQSAANLANPVYKYVVTDALTTQNIVAPQVIPSDPTYGTPRVFLLNNYFIIVYSTFVSGNYQLQYVAVSIDNPSIAMAPVIITTSYTPSAQIAFDGTVLNDNLYLAWNGGAASGIKMAYLTQALSLSSTVIRDASHSATLVSMAVSEDSSQVWVNYYDSVTKNAFALATDSQLNSILTPSPTWTNADILNLTSTVSTGFNKVFAEINNAYSFNAAVPTHYIEVAFVNLLGLFAGPNVLVRSLGLMSEAFLYDGVSYFIAVYVSPYQSTYFLINENGKVIAELAYGNATGYALHGLSTVTVDGNEISFVYLKRDLVQPPNTNTNPPAGSQVVGVYSQSGINLAKIRFTTENMDTLEAADSLLITGGITWAYDGYEPNEQGFFLYPDSVEATTSATGGLITAGQYFYKVTYEWTDNQGNAFKSAPSLPITVTTTGGASLNTIHIPTLRLTYKTANPVKIVVYRYSVAQPIYYQVSSVSMPLLNDTTVDFLDFPDDSSDADILGRNILYTNGGVLENIGPPALDDIFLFDDRVFGITSEDKRLLWYSQKILQDTPVEFSDQLTLYIAPNSGAQGSTGPLTCGFQMDDKLILFNASGMSYINGTGPDSTGANSQYSEPIFITSTVGCSNSKSIILTPMGLMFEFASQSGNQIWLLGRDLTTVFLGAPVSGLTQEATVQSSDNIPGTNSVRFTLDSGITLNYDTFYGQWDTFSNTNAVSSILYEGLHTYINSRSEIYQETPNKYLDGDRPVLINFKTGWINLAGLQGYQRAYYFYLLGTYFSPHKLIVQVAYDYNSAPVQQSIISPDNFAGTYGQGNYGSQSPYGGPGNLEQWKIFFERQRCMAFQVTVQEIFDPAYGTVAGKGFTLSGINCQVAIKKGWRPISASHAVG